MPTVPTAPSGRIHSWVSAYLRSSGTSIAFCITVFSRQSREIFAREHLFQLFALAWNREHRHSPNRCRSPGWEIACHSSVRRLVRHQRKRRNEPEAEETFHRTSEQPAADAGQLPSVPVKTRVRQTPVSQGPQKTRDQLRAASDSGRGPLRSVDNKLLCAVCRALRARTVWLPARLRAPEDGSRRPPQPRRDRIARIHPPRYNRFWPATRVSLGCGIPGYDFGSADLRTVRAIQPIRDPGPPELQSGR